MHRQFHNVLTKFYQTIVKNQPLSGVLANSLQRYLSYSELEEEKTREHDEEPRSFRSGTSSLSDDSYKKIKKLFHTSKIENAMLFACLLHMVKNNQKEQVSLIIKSVTFRLKQYERFITPDDKKRFSTKLDKLNEDLSLLSSKAENNCKVDWPFYEVFLQFQGECLLFTRLLSSISQNLESEEAISSNDYTNFCSVLQIKCLVFDYEKKMPFEMGTGDIKIYLGNKSETYFIESDKDFERATQASRKEIRETNRRQQNQSKNLRELKKYQTVKFKEEFLAEMTKLKQEYDANTTKIASLFNFKDSAIQDELMTEDRQA